jgi:hypothetical protein
VVIQARQLLVNLYALDSSEVFPTNSCRFHHFWVWVIFKGTQKITDFFLLNFFL